MRTITTLLLTVVAGIGFAASAASAAPITFIHTAVDGSGTIDGVQFVRKDITITAVGDTASRFDFGNGYLIEHVSASISIEDVGTFDFITSTHSFAAVNGIAGFGRASNGADLVHTGLDPSVSTWDMLSSLGPVNGSGAFLQWGLGPAVETSGGALFFNFNSGLGGTFEAIVIPAPASIAAFASVGLLAGRRRR